MECLDQDLATSSDVKPYSKWLILPNLGTGRQVEETKKKRFQIRE